MALKPGDLAPVFELPRCGGEGAIRDNSHKLIVFYKVTCPTCQLTLPFVERLFKNYGEVVSFVGISQDSCKDTLRFMNNYGLTFPQLSDENGYRVSIEFDIQTVPTIYLLDASRKVVFVEEGFVKSSMEKLNTMLSEITRIGENPLFEDVSVPAFKAG